MRTADYQKGALSKALYGALTRPTVSSQVGASLFFVSHGWMIYILFGEYDGIAA